MNDLNRLAWITLLSFGIGFWAACGTDDVPPNSEGICDDECALGDRNCVDERVLDACRRNAEGCFEKRTITCLPTETCESGNCVPQERDCEDSCTPPDARCTNQGEVESCADHTRDGCFEFGDPQACSANQICDPADGLCKASECDDPCTQGETECQDGLLATCAPSPGGCLRFLGGKECPQNETCQNGACVPTGTCEDECSGESICAIDGGLRSCSDADEDGCNELSEPEACPVDSTCRSGECRSNSDCFDTCRAGEAVCLGNDIARCEQQADGCLAFAPPAPCSDAAQTCISGDSGARCETTAITGPVVINEVFYNPTGDDYRSGSSPTFIEVSGPGGMSIEGYTIELINGADGLSYNRFTFPNDARLGGNGLAVMAMTEPDSHLASDAPGNIYFEMTSYASGQDAIQNGPDNVVLEDAAGTVVDAVAYGTFAAGDPGFFGESSAVPSPVPGRSIGRVRGAADTDDNSVDFRSFYPTPGLHNSDLIINEIYFDQPGADGVAGQTETFVELIAPILGWEDIPLDGYVLRAVNGFDDQDYIFSTDSMGNPVVNGIEMSTINLNDGPSDGIVVVCNIDLASPALINVCTVPYEGSDFQNGPDYFVLEYNGREVDSVAYGTFSSTPAFGEGTPVGFSGSIAGQSLGRWPISDPSQPNDTDDNATDFHILNPSPAADNPLPNP